MTEDDSTMWVTTEPSAVAPRRFVVRIGWAPGLTEVMEPARARRYAAEVIAVAARAEYEYAVLHLAEDRLQLSRAVSAQLIADLREKRPPANRDATAPVLFTAGVSAFTGEPYLTIFNDREETIGHLSPAAARSHAVAVLEAIAVAEDDTALTSALVDVIGIDPARANGVLADLDNHRPARPEGDPS